MTHRAAQLLVLASLVTLVGSAAAVAQDLTDVAEIVERANLAAYYAGDDGRAEVRLTIIEAGGDERIRVLTILRKDVSDGGDQHFLVVLARPAELRGTVFLVAKHPEADDDRWLYLPDLDLVRRIAAGDRRTSFVGSHFFYEDVSGRSPAEDAHSLVETNDTHYVVDSTPVDASSVEFVSYRVWIDKTTFLPMRIEYTDDTGAVYRTVETLTVETLGGHPTATSARVSDVRSGGSTLVEFRNVEYDLGIPDDIFVERSLRNPPSQWFRARR